MKKIALMMMFVWANVGLAQPVEVDFKKLYLEHMDTHGGIMKKETIVSLVLDETGSMTSVKGKTISGFNEYIDGLKKIKNKVLFTLTKFNSDMVKVVYNTVKIKDVKHLTDNSYQPQAMTPLYDAIGTAINQLSKNLKEAKQKVLFVILTDGLENHSQEYTSEQITNLIEEKRDEGWQFVFLGANQDAWIQGQKFGMLKGNTMSYDSQNIKGMMGQTLLNATVAYSSSATTPTSTFVDTYMDIGHKKKSKKK